jgi:hypothetical protein
MADGHTFVLPQGGYMAQTETFEVTLDEKAMENIETLKRLMGVEDVAELFKRSLAIVEALQTLDAERYELIARSSHPGVADKRIEITQRPKFAIRLVIPR